MDEIIKKVSAYDLLNALIPGGALVYSMKLLGYLDIDEAGALYLVILAYVLGLVGSRIGSLILEPVGLKFGWINREYETFVKARKDDVELDRIATVANMYRTLAGSMIVLAVLALGVLVPGAQRCLLYVGYGVSCFLLFLFGWIKQESYVSQRVNIGQKNEDGTH